jgi:thioredoxin-related protein
MKTRISLLAVLSVFLMSGIGRNDTAPTGENTKDKQEATQKESEPKTEITWMKYDEGLALAKEKGKKVFVEFTAKWCGWCKKMHATTFKDPEIVKLMDEYFVSVSVDGDSRDTLNIDGWITSERKLARQYRVSSYPTYWFLTSEAEQIAPVKGYRDKATLSQILDYLKDDLYKTVSFQDYIDSKKKK